MSFGGRFGLREDGIGAAMAMGKKASITPQVGGKRSERRGRRKEIKESFFHQLLRLVDLCGEIRTSAAVGMVEQHELAMSFADHFRGRALTVESKEEEEKDTC